MAPHPIRLSLKIVAIVLSVYAVSFLFCGVALTVHAQSDLQTTKYRNMVIDLGNGLKTNARLNLPSNGDGPFPAVLIIGGSGAGGIQTTGSVTAQYTCSTILFKSLNIFQKEVLQCYSMTERCRYKSIIYRSQCMGKYND